MRETPLTKPSARVVYIAYVVLTLFPRIVYWLLSSLLPWTRPRHAWSFFQSFSFQFLRFYHDVRCRLAKPPSIRSEIREGKGFKSVLVEGTPNLIVGGMQVWARKAKVEAVNIPGHWIHGLGAEFALNEVGGSETVVYYLSGGDFIRPSARPNDVKGVYRRLFHHCGTVKRIFVLDYRWSSAGPYPTRFPFPAALIDAVAGYAYLVKTFKCPPSRIVVMGNSAGGNLALALVRYLSNNPSLKLPLPKGVILTSPWVDLDMTATSPSSSLVTNASSSYLTPRKKGEDYYAVRAYVGPLWEKDQFMKNEYICPASLSLPSISFRGFPKTFIAVGSAESILDQIRSLHNRMKSYLGEANVTYFEGAGAFHSFIELPAWVEPESAKAWNGIADFIRKL